MPVLALALVIVALILGVVAVIEARGRAWAAWGVVALAVAALLTMWPGR